ncbi:MAG: outer membrane lipoprotein carrier protein LolA [Proteobacteria bacterium]|nr:outer membrane lipoprotein carrier protein LolA [Pseudomonadota bacterium]MBS0574708.1 outer membrane lipoprotein carrier protein LolA [Pseudomonadota bacterium]
MRILRLLAALAALSLATAASGAEIPLATLSAYLNGLTTAETTFRQINPDGTSSSGKVIIERPGRMRFEYAKPDKTLVLASAGSVAIFDAKSNQPPEQYPLAKTPLSLILGAKIDLTSAQMVVGHREEGGLTLVTAQDPAHPEYGQLELGFSADPVALRQWVVTDANGAQTIVLLGNLKVGGSYPPAIFSITGETEARLRKR